MASDHPVESRQSQHAASASTTARLDTDSIVANALHLLAVGLNVHHINLERRGNRTPGQIEKLNVDLSKFKVKPSSTSAIFVQSLNRPPTRRIARTLIARTQRNNRNIDEMRTQPQRRQGVPRIYSDSETGEQTHMIEPCHTPNRSYARRSYANSTPTPPAPGAHSARTPRPPAGSRRPHKTITMPFLISSLGTIRYRCPTTPRTERNNPMALVKLGSTVVRYQRHNRAESHSPTTGRDRQRDHGAFQ